MHVHALEPEPEAASQLNNGFDKKRFRNFRVYQIAVGNQAKSITLNITRKPSMSSVLNPDISSFRRSFGEAKNGEEWIRDLDVVRKIEVTCKSLETIFREHINSGFVDFLKIDAQGTELDILQSGVKMLRDGRAGVICVEVSFFPIYKGQAHFSDVDSFLRDCGYRFVDCRMYSDVIEREDSFTPGEKLYERPKSTSVGDAWYVNDKFKLQTEVQEEIQKRLRCAIILGAEGYFSEASDLLNGIIEEKQRNELFRYLTYTTGVSRFKHFIRRWMPPAILQARARMKKS